MKRIAQKLAVRAARQDVAVGVATGIVLTAVRALSLIAFIGTAAVPYGLLGWALIVECLLYVACTVGI